MMIDRDFIRKVLDRVQMRPNEWETLACNNYIIHFYLDTEKYPESYRNRYNRSKPSTKNLIKKDSVLHYYGDDYKNLLSIDTIGFNELRMYCVNGTPDFIAAHLKTNYNIIVDIPQKYRKVNAMTPDEYKRKYMEAEKRREEGEKRLEELAKEYGLSLRVYSSVVGAQREERTEALVEMGLLFPDEIITKKRQPRSPKKVELGQGPRQRSRK